MILRSLSLHNFKNIPRASLQFSSKINCLLGNNGMGKSNLLDAVYYLSFCKSFSGVADAMLITRNEDFCMIQADYQRKGVDESLSVGMQRGRRKSFKRSGKEYRRLSEHIGKFPAVLVSPADMELINGTGEERRRFMDMVISQTDPKYLDSLIRYNHALEQRNRMLRDGLSDPALFEAVETAMAAAATYICATRSRKVVELSVIFDGYYRDIAACGEQATLTYKSHLADNGAGLIDILNQRRARDTALGYTSAGPHRDDIDMQLCSMPVRRTASQGQAKTYSIALRLAQYDFLCRATAMKPLLLLDDIFDKLDADRVARIMEVVSRDNFGQIFITDTNRKHLDEILDHAGGNYAMWTVDAGAFTEITS